MIGYKTYSASDYTNSTETINYDNISLNQSARFVEKLNKTENELSLFYLNAFTRFFIDLLLIRRRNQIHKKDILSILNWEKLGKSIDKDYILHYMKDITFIRKNFSIRNQEEVLEFLFNNSNLLPVIIEAKERIEEIFESSNLFIEVIKEADDMNSKELFIIIQTDINSDEAYEKIKLLDNNWFLSIINEIGNNIVIDVEFI